MSDFLKAVAMLGVPGSTARWVAHLYHRRVRLTPDDPLDMASFITTLISTRYDVDALIRPCGPTPRIRVALGAVHDAGRIRGLCHAVVLILTAEADYATRPPEENVVLVEVVGSEVTALGVPPKDAYGRDLHIFPPHLCAVCRPTFWMPRFRLTA